MTLAVVSSDTSQSVPPAVTDGSQAPAEDASGFTLWPTGVLAAVLVLGLIALLIAANRPGNQQTVRRRR